MGSWGGAQCRRKSSSEIIVFVLEWSKSTWLLLVKKIEKILVISQGETRARTFGYLRLSYLDIRTSEGKERSVLRNVEGEISLSPPKAYFLISKKSSIYPKMIMAPWKNIWPQYCMDSLLPDEPGLYYGPRRLFMTTCQPPARTFPTMAFLQAVKT